MTKRVRLAALTALSAVSVLFASAPAAAQADILLQLRSGSPVTDRFRVDSAGGVIAIGQLGYGIIPASGAGVRMMWHPFKAAFRVGEASASGEFDDANVGFYSFGGGIRSIASAYATFAFGDQVRVSGTSAAGFGSSSEVRGTAAFSAGASNRACGFGSVTIGYTNTTGAVDASGCLTGSGQGAVAIGYRATADADYAVAIGQRASANGRSGAIVFADASTTDSIEASANNQFSARAAGGYRLYTNATLTAGMTMSAGGSSWNAVSDRNRKENFLNVDGEDVLRRLASVPVSTWQYRAEEDRTVRHMGPMAQDWQRAFGFSGDDKTINMSDFDGVNLAAIQALEARTTTLQQQLSERDRRIAELEARLDRLERLVTAQPKN